MRKLLYVLFAMLLLGRLEAASACSDRYPPRSDADLFAKASAVFVAHIVRADEIRMQHPDGDEGGVPAVEATFRLVEVLKGRPPADGRVREPLPHICTRSLLVGLEYVIFLDGDILWAKDEGTRPLFDGPTAEDKWCSRKQCQLEKLRALAKKAP